MDEQTALLIDFFFWLNEYFGPFRSSEAFQRLNPDRYLEPSEPRVARGDSCPTDTLHMSPECRLTSGESSQSADFPAKSSESSLRTLNFVDKNSVMIQNETR